MTKELDLDTYLIITNYKFVICIFNKKNFKNIYKQEFTFKNKIGAIDFNSLSKFLENNIFKIEKLTSKFTSLTFSSSHPLFFPFVAHVYKLYIILFIYNYLICRVSSVHI